MKLPHLIGSTLAAAALLLAGACTDAPTTPSHDAPEASFGKGSGRPGGGGPNATISYGGDASMSASDAGILVDSRKKFQAESCCGGTSNMNHIVSWSLATTASACSATSATLQTHLTGFGATAAYTVWFMDRSKGTGSFKLIYDQGGHGPFVLTLAGEMTEAGGLNFTLTGPGSVTMDWPTNFADQMGLPQIETCGSFANTITADVDPT